MLGPPNRETISLDRKKIFFFIACLLFITSYLIIAIRTNLFLTLTIGIVISCMAMTYIFLRPWTGLLIYIFLVFTIRFFTDYLQVLPPVLNLLPDLLLILVLGLSWLKESQKGNWKIPWITIPVSLLVVEAVFSGAINQNLGIGFLNSLLRLYIKPILIFFIIYSYKPDWKKTKQLLLLIAGLTLFQIPVVLFQAIRSGFGSAGYRAWDMIAGTVGYAGGGVLLLLCLMMMPLFLGWGVFKRSVKWFIAFLLLFIPPIIGEGKAFFFYVPVLVLYLFIRWKRIRFQTVLLIFLAVVFAYIGAILLFRQFLPDSYLLKFLENPSTILLYESTLQSGRQTLRLGDFQLTYSLMMSDPLRFLFGYGPGSASFGGTLGTGMIGDLAAAYKDYLPYFGGTQITSSLLEYGILGLAIYTWMIYEIYREDKYLLKVSLKNEERAIVWAMRGVIFMFIFGAFYLRIWNTELLAIIFWVMAGILRLIKIYRFSSDRLTSTIK